MKKVRKRNRRSIKSEKIASTIRKEIVGGIREPGSMLPTRENLIADFKVSSATLQKSIDQLISEGFIETNGSNGSYVTATPPNIYQIGFVIYERSKKLLVYQSILQSIKEIEKETPYRFKMYSFLDDYKNQVEIEQLAKDIKNGCLAGVISFHITPSELEEYKIFNYSNVPILLHIANSEKCKFDKSDNIIKSSFNYMSMIDGAIEILNKNGIKDAAWIVHEDFSYKNMDYLLRVCEESGLNNLPHWIQAGSLKIYECLWLENITRLLMFAEKRPEAFVVLDENLVLQVMSGLDKLKIKIPDDVQVIAHSSFPEASIKYEKFNRIGFDIYKFLTDGIRMLSNWKQELKYSEYLIKSIEREV